MKTKATNGDFLFFKLGKTFHARTVYKQLKKEIALSFLEKTEFLSSAFERVDIRRKMRR